GFLLLAGCPKKDEKAERGESPPVKDKDARIAKPSDPTGMDDEITFEGKPLSYWLAQLKDGGGKARGWAGHGLGGMGTEQRRGGANPGLRTPEVASMASALVLALLKDKSPACGRLPSTLCGACVRLRRRRWPAPCSPTMVRFANAPLWSCCRLSTAPSYR